MEINPHKATKVVLAATVLHNYMRCHSSYVSNDSGEGQSSLERQTSSNGYGLRRVKPCLQNPSVSAKQIRAKFAAYFMTAGQVSWQCTIK
jgi:hypothetical protein